MNNASKWHDAETDKPKTSAPVLLRVEIDKNPRNVVFMPGYYSGYEYCNERGKVLTHECALTHYDRVTHWIELP